MDKDCTLSLTQAAHTDLYDIWQYTAKQWGVVAADEYLSVLDVAMERLRLFPYTGAAVEEIDAALRSVVCSQHRIFYYVNGSVIGVIAVLHVRADKLAALSLGMLRFMLENPAFLSSQLITYLGNKRKLLPQLSQAVAQVQGRLGARKLVIADMFAGTGVTSRLFKQFASRLIVNDLERYSELTQRCYLSNCEDVPTAELADAVRALNALPLAAGFITHSYAPKDETCIGEGERVFYTRRNAMFLDTVRHNISSYPADLQNFLIAPLLALASVHANTSGVFKGFYKSADGVGQYGGQGRHALSRIMADMVLEIPVFSNFSCDVEVRREDANSLAHHLPACDVVYLDPPYNQHPYGSNYFMLNVLADYVPPEQVSKVSGIPKDWNRSVYNEKASAEDALFALIDALPASHIIISYNSEGFISHQRFLTRLQSYRHHFVIEVPYNTFRGSRNLAARAKHVTEFVYVLEK